MSVSGISSSSAIGIGRYEESYSMSDVYLANSDPLPYKTLNGLKIGTIIKDKIYSNAFSSRDRGNPHNIILEEVTLKKLSSNRFEIITTQEYEINPPITNYRGYVPKYDFKSGEFELIFDGTEPFGYHLYDEKRNRKSQLWKLRISIGDRIKFIGGPHQPSRGMFEGFFSGGIIKRKSKKSKKHRKNKKTKTYKK
jgi:hypothetical protein